MKALLVVVVVLLGVAVAADRLAAGWAGRRVAEEVVRQGGLAGTPDVDIRGFPFLTQVIDERYDEVRISLTAAELRQPEGTRADLTLRGVRVRLSTLLSGSVEEVPVERVDGTATLSYDLLSAQLGPGTTLRAEDGGLRITRTVELLGQTLPVTAVGQVGLDGGDLLIDVDQASGAGIEIPGFLVDRVSDLLDVRYALPQLPFGLRLTHVDPASDGVRIGLEATDTVLRP